MLPCRGGAVAAALVALAACDAPPSSLARSYPNAISCTGDTRIEGAPALPRNVIFLMGDGMGPEQLAAGALARGEPLAIATELAGPVYLNTDSITTDRTGDPDSAPTDSAAGATAIATGVRTLNGKIAMDADDQIVETIAEIARADGRAIGLVTTSFVYDASPASFAAHAKTRSATTEIASDILRGVRPEVWFGAGQAKFDANDGELASQAVGEGYAILRDAEALAGWDPDAAPRALGLFPESPPPVPGVHAFGLTPAVLRTPDSADPPLPEMVARALDRLEDAPDGFLLFVETEHTDTLGHIALSDMETALAGIPAEVAELDRAVEVVLDWVAASSSFDDTLVVVGADHETGGYIFDGEDPATASFPHAPLHTRLPIPFFAAGPGAEHLESMCRTSDVFLLFTGRLPAP